MKLFALMLALIALSACAPLSHSDSVSIESKFQPYVDQFKVQAQTSGHPVNITDLVVQMDYSMAGPTGGTWTLGSCTMGSSDSSPTIRVNPNFWNNSAYTNESREQLLFHELGHCILGRKHDDTTVWTTDHSRTVQRTIMATYHFGDSQYDINHAYYVNELFGGSTSMGMVASGPNQWTNIYAAIASTMSSTKTYTMTSDELKPGVAGSIEGMGCGD